MKKLYPKTIIIHLLFPIFFISIKTYGQCPNSGAPGSTAYDTTIAFGSGIVSTNVKFPKFDPQNGMVTCVKLCVTIKGIIDTIAMENYTNAAQTGSYTYTRKDTITGPGIPTYLTSNATVNSPSFPLAPNNSVFFSGPDFYSQGSDTILTRTLCTTISDSTNIVQFYGVNDSATYNYSVDANINDLVTGGSAFKFVLSSALVNFHFEYCTCPVAVLPLNIRDLFIRKITIDQAEIKWTANDDPERNYRYEVEMSSDGYHFSSISALPKNISTNNDNYKFVYSLRNNDKDGNYFFRVKQIYSNGYTRFSDIKFVDLQNTGLPKFNFYPNPSNGIVGIKFDNISGGKLLVQVINMQGQAIVNKEILVSGASYCQIATLQKGMYWLKLTDVTKNLSCVNQLLIK